MLLDFFSSGHMGLKYTYTSRHSYIAYSHRERLADLLERSHIWSQKMKREDTVKLISADGFEFVIDKKAAMVSQTIRNMLTSPGSFAETQHGEVTFPEISTTILEKICQYFYWSLQYASGKETEFHIEPELTLELMMAANYLHT
ncbi:Elongin-C [Camellia lanceoleosa]|uniref:Elongin-C n=1 Tax=Camellia lanceoleosa TaxID=1840588 RepID=A0ACC0HRG5_9ERIC|nr:Elongin-C [Camellia lanceoleosa]